MVAPWQETQFRVVVEFKKGSRGVSRDITLTHSPNVLPPQLYGRVTPEVWGVFMAEVGQMAHSHPYTQRPDAEQVCGWLGGTLCWLCIGFGFFPGDGDYRPWLAQLEAVLDRHRAAFAAGGAALSVQRVHGSYWVQIDVDPRAMAVGSPVPAGVPMTYGGPPALPGGYAPKEV